MDSLRYWVTECHVDGFRFDLASALAREFFEVDRLSAFFDVIHQDPVLSQVKLIAEPWDVGPGGYQVGNFPVLWSEWNGPYRDTMRDCWRGYANNGEFGERDSRARRTCTRPTAAIRSRRSTSSPPTTASRSRDLVSYDDKHNEANMRGQPATAPTTTARGTAAPRAPTDDPGILALRARQQRNFLTTLFALAGHADAARRRRARPHAARQQQRLVPGQRAVVVRLDR